MGMKRHDALISILKRLQESKPQLRYQIRLGKDDLELRCKNHFQFDYRPYVRIDLATIDPNGETPDWELTFKTENPFSHRAGGGENEKKRPAEESPEDQKTKKRNRFVPEWQIGEFLWTFLEGTKTTLVYNNDNLDLESEAADENETLQEVADNTPDATETEAEDILDTK